MATKRLSNYEKALNRLFRVQDEAMGVRPSRSEPGVIAERWDRALDGVLQAHWEEHPDEGECQWCTRYPPLNL